MQWAWFKKEHKREVTSSDNPHSATTTTRERRMTRERASSLGRRLRGSLGKQRTRESDMTEAARGIFGEEYSMGCEQHQVLVSSSFSSGDGGACTQGGSSNKPPYTTITTTTGQRGHNENGPTFNSTHSDGVSDAQDSGMISPKTRSEDHLEQRNIGLAVTTAVEDAAAAAGAEAGFRATMEARQQAHRKDGRPVSYELEASSCDAKRKEKEKDHAFQYPEIRQPGTKPQRVTNDSLGGINPLDLATDTPTSTLDAAAQDEPDDDAPPPSPVLPKPSTFPFRGEASENTSQRSLPLSIENSIRLVEAEGEGRVLEKLENWG